MIKTIFERIRTIRTKLRNHFPRLLPYEGKYIKTCEDKPLPDNIIPGDGTEVIAAHSPQPCKFRLDKNGEIWEIKLPYEKKWRTLCEEDSNRVTSIVSDDNFKEPIIAYVCLEKEVVSPSVESLPALPYYEK